MSGNERQIREQERLIWKGGGGKEDGEETGRG